ncbi:pilus assembly protein TadG-related protein [Streptomyces sp. NPDC048269]|uniref:pilus assembly protein TadG-related protein n=1 Tax=Streptomyces sp. NPDC048269 TaxID=3155753 RepID=UPI0034244C15
MTEEGFLSDKGQAFPIYIVVVAGLLFAALAFFVVGMAGATRSDAQGAADAAALAAAREARDNVFLGLDLLALKPADWEKIANGDLLDGEGACGMATEFAALNDATANCTVAIPEFTVAVTTNDTVGSSVIPGSGDLPGKATAKARIEPRCELRSAPTPAPSPTPSPASTASPSPSPGAGSVTFVCSGKSLAVDPAKPGAVSQLARALFTVRLVD